MLSSPRHNGGSRIKRQNLKKGFHLMVFIFRIVILKFGRSHVNYWECVTLKACCLNKGIKQTIALKPLTEEMFYRFDIFITTAFCNKT